MTQMKVRYKGNLHTECTHESGAVIETDAPKDNQGKGEAFSPTDLFAVSVGSCMLTLMSMAGNKLGVELKGMTAEIDKQMVNDPKRRVGKIIVRIRSEKLPSSEIQKELEQAAFDCPVHLSLHPNIKIELDFIWGL